MPQKPLEQLLQLVAFDDPGHARRYIATLAESDALDAVIDELVALEEPDDLAWYALCDLLSALPSSRVAARVKEIEPALERTWPDTLRWAPDAWYRSVREEQREPRWGLVRALELGGERLRDAQLLRILQASDVSKLRILMLADNALGGDLGRVLDRNTLPALTTLELSRNPIGPDGLKDLASASLLPHIKRLALSNIEADDESFATFLKRASLHTLTTLDISHNPISEYTAHALQLSPWIHQLRELSLAHSNLGDAGLSVLARAERFSRLTTLVLSNANIHGPGLAAWAEHASTPAIERVLLDGNALEPTAFAAFVQAERCCHSLLDLDLSSAHLGPTGAEALAASEALPNLQTLILRENNIDLRGARALAAAPHLTALTTLDLYKNGLGFEGVEAFAHALELPNLTTLDLGMNAMLDIGLAALAATQTVTLLERLSLSWNDITSRGLSAFFAASLPKLTALDLSVNLLNDAAIRLLARAQLRLTELNLSWNGLESLCGKHIAESETLATLIELNLSNNMLGDEGAQNLAASPHLRSLKHLDLARNSIEDAGVITLAESPLLASLETLDLSSNLIRGKGIEALVKAPQIANLRELNLENNPLTQENIDALENAPHLRARIRTGRTENL